MCPKVTPSLRKGSCTSAVPFAAVYVIAEPLVFVSVSVADPL
jgi:hypothetical protein